MSDDRFGLLGTTLRPKLTLDLFHVFSQRKAVLLDEQHYFGVDADRNQTRLNPGYLQPILYQPPFNARIRLVVDY